MEIRVKKSFICFWGIFRFRGACGEAASSSLAIRYRSTRMSFLPFLLVRAVFVVSLPSFLVTLSGLECSFSSYFEVCMGWLDANVC